MTTLFPQAVLDYANQKTNSLLAIYRLDANDAADIKQEFYLALIHAKPRYALTCQAKTYLKRVIDRTALHLASELKNRKRKTPPTISINTPRGRELAEEVPNPTDTYEELCRIDDYRILRIAIRLLPEPYCAIGEFYLKNRYLTTISRQLGISWATFRTWTWPEFKRKLRIQLLTLIKERKN